MLLGRQRWRGLRERSKNSFMLTLGVGRGTFLDRAEGFLFSFGA